MLSGLGFFMGLGLFYTVTSLRENYVTLVFYTDPPTKTINYILAEAALTSVLLPLT